MLIFVCFLYWNLKWKLPISHLILCDLIVDFEKLARSSHFCGVSLYSFGRVELINASDVRTKGTK